MATQQKSVRVLVNKKGVELTTERSDREAFDELERRLRDGEIEGQFPTDLITRGAARGLSDEQFWWVHKLLEPRQHIELEAMAIVERMHQVLRNGAKVRHLKIDFPTDAGIVRFSMAGHRSKYHGDIWVTDDGNYPSNRLYGRIERETGTFKGHNVPDAVQQLITTVQDNPEKHLPW